MEQFFFFFFTETATLAYKACIDVAFDKQEEVAACLFIGYLQSLQIISV